LLINQFLVERFDNNSYNNGKSYTKGLFETNWTENVIKASSRFLRWLIQP